MKFLFVEISFVLKARLYIEKNWPQLLFLNKHTKILWFKRKKERKEMKEEQKKWFQTFPHIIIA